MFPIYHVVAYEFQDQNFGIYKWGVDWLFLKEDLRSGEIKGNLCVCFQQASELLDCVIRRMKVWIN